jgi:hypothetical protein
LQLAGPRLTPASVLFGLRSAPVETSTDPQVPSCAYSGVDFTCLADAQAALWDASGNQPNAGGIAPIGCWRAIEGGRRHRIGAWPPGNIDAQVHPNDPCDLAVGP